AGGATLAPFYDLLSTVAYSDLSPKLAMKIAKRATLEEIGPTTWPAFAEDIGLAVPFVRRRVKELAGAAITQAPSIPGSPGLAGLNAGALKEHSALIVSRAERVARTSTK
ncbi:MAG: type II toxin-antitoxin system HipA family toxin, partial [Vicinamibacterales bacterium]